MSVTTRSPILRGVTRSADPEVAARELYEAIGHPRPELVIFFCSSRYDRNALAAALGRSFGDTPLVGCTTSGEIGPAGYIDGGITAAALPSGDFHAATRVLENLESYQSAQGAAAGLELRAELNEKTGGWDPRSSFGLLLIDGLSMREEIVAGSLAQSMDEIPVFGGSAGDDLAFEKTWVYARGRFHENAAVLTVIQTARPFTVFKSQHFVSTDTRFVVTAADAELRVVHELNGEPAARAYARAVQVEESELCAEAFATYPVVVKIGGDIYVRSIQKKNEDGSLTFYCAIDEGIVLSLAGGVDSVEHVQKLFGEIRGEIGPPDLVLGCDCILRNLEFKRKGVRSRVAEILTENHVVGFSTYGEQINGMHVNQTLTGVAIARGGNSDG